MIETVLTDIEGTTSAIAFVKDELFPYAARALPTFVREHAADPAVRAQLDAVIRAGGLPPGDVEGAIALLLRAIERDEKSTALKALQGMVWARGYAEGAFRAHVYRDAFDALTRWHAEGIELYVYSSGSVAAQRLFFRHTVFGDLSSLFLGYFDTTTGSKRESASYERIAEAMKRAPDEVLFLSDVTEELEAADAAGMAVHQLQRPDDYPGASALATRFPVSDSFTGVDIIHAAR